MTDKELMARLGAGMPITAVCRDAGITRDEFDNWWKETCRARLSRLGGTCTVPVAASVQILRDGWGIPHIFAESDEDLFFGFGYAMAQDRLFQLDYLRRKGLGRLSEILGPDGLELDLIARTVGLNRIAQGEWKTLPEETRTVLEAFSAGINAWIENRGDNLPVEFDLLDYQPDTWTPLDCLAIENEFRWYLTGRFPVIAIPEMAKRVLGDGPLYKAFLLGEADIEAIIPSEWYAGQSDPFPPDSYCVEPVGDVVSDPDAATGSNNWVVAGDRTKSRRPMIGSDPHIAFEAVSCWYEAHLCGGSFNVAGMTYVGMPAIMFGRSEWVAWGITNNICSLRDLYQEKTSAEHPGCFLYDGNWEPAAEQVEKIDVKAAEPVTRTVRSSRNGPIVDEILPSPANQTGPVSLKWLGAHQGGWLTALLGMDRAETLPEFCEALRPWHVPTFNLVIADEAGNIAVQSSGRIPHRNQSERAYRPGWLPEHQWNGLIPFELMPSASNPHRGWLASANNRVAQDDFPLPLSGTWGSAYRARRIRDMIEARQPTQKLSGNDFRSMHQDSLSLRAVHCVPQLLAVLESSGDERISEAAAILADWDCRTEPESVGTTIFNVFFSQWTEAVVAERFADETARFVTKGGEGLAVRLLSEDAVGWFQNDDREQRILETFQRSLTLLEGRFGEHMSQWTWGRLHQMPLKHVLSSRGDLAQLLDHGGEGVRGDMVTVCNTGSGPDWIASTGAGYRLIVDLGTSSAGLWAVDAQSQSGQPGSPHYSDQFSDWKDGQYHWIPMDRQEAHRTAEHTLVLQPQSPH